MRIPTTVVGVLRARVARVSCAVLVFIRLVRIGVQRAVVRAAHAVFVGVKRQVRAMDATIERYALIDGADVSIVTYGVVAFVHTANPALARISCAGYVVVTAQGRIGALSRGGIANIICARVGVITEDGGDAVTVSSETQVLRGTRIAVVASGSVFRGRVLAVPCLGVAVSCGLARPGVVASDRLAGTFPSGADIVGGAQVSVVTGSVVRRIVA